MAGPDLTNDFNSASSSFFSWLLRLFSGPSTAAPTANQGHSLFSGLENLLKLMFSWLDPQSQQPTSTTPTTRSAPQTQPRTFMGRVKDNLSSAAGTIRDDFNAVTNSVGNFFHGAAFDISKAISRLKGDCHSKPGGACLAHVEEALTAGGLRYAGGKTIADVMPVRIGSNGQPTHWAKDLPQVLGKDPRFSEVATGYGANFNANYTPQKGDIVAWTGGQYGHTQICTGFENGKPIWASDYQTSASNWTGLRDANSHGQFVIYRQKAADDPTALASAQPKPSSRQGLNA